MNFRASSFNSSEAVGRAPSHGGGGISRKAGNINVKQV